MAANPLISATPIGESQGRNGYRWANVAIGGGGFVTGIYLSPQQRDLAYVRTDVGGFYRWNSGNKTWVPLNDSFPLEFKTYYGGEAFAVDPNNPDIVYMAAGKYSAWTPKGSLFKSINRGQTWQKLNLDLGMDSNDEHRWSGQRLAVNPHNSQEIWFGSRHDGLWKSKNGGETWQSVTNLLPIEQFKQGETRGIGVLGIVFDSIPGKVYTNVYGQGIYQSVDSGETWQKIPNSPRESQRLAVSSTGILYVTHLQGVSRWQEGKWTDISPTKTAFNALAINPKNPQDILVSLKQSTEVKIYRSQDGGKSWKVLVNQLQHTVPWWDDAMFGLWTSAIAFDPQIPGKVWLTDGFGIWQTEDINASPVTWTNHQRGHEEVVVFSLVSPPQGPLLLSGVADVDGFYHNQGLDTYPSRRFDGISPHPSANRDTFGMSYSAQNPLNVVRVGGSRWNSTYRGATSRDGGKTWQSFANFPAKTLPLRVAVSATDPQLFLVTVSEGQPLRTTDGGKSWQPVKGLPDGVSGPWYWGQPLAADSQAGQTFYYYQDGNIYRSKDEGASFQKLPVSLPQSDWYALKTPLNLKNELWWSGDWKGLYRSSDGGNSFSKLPNVERAHLFSFGKPPAGNKIPALYLYGRVQGQGDGIFRSLDLGQTWVDISSPTNPIGGEPNFMEGSWQEFGLVFLGTNGRGIFYGRNVP